MNTILIIPGMDGTGTLFRPWIKRWQQEGWTVLLLRHDDETAWVNGVQSVESLTCEMRHCLDAAAAAKSLIIGESFGSMAALRFAETNPKRVSGVVLLAGFAAAESQWARRFIPLVRRFSLVIPAVLLNIAVRLASRVWNPLLSPDDQPELRHAVRSLHCPGARCLLAKLLLVLNYDVRGPVQKLTVPVLVVSGTTDRLITHRSARRLHAMVPEASFLALPGGHLSHHSHRELVQITIAEWMKHFRRP